MPHIHNEPGQYDHTVTAYIVRNDTDEPKILVHMHRKLNKLLAIGGHIELDETPWQAISHELKEESGYSLSELEILQPTPRISHLSGVTFHPYPVSMNTHAISEEHSHSDIQYAFVAQGPPVGDVEEGESTDLRWLTQKELNELSSDTINLNTREVYNFIIDFALTKWEPVPTSTYSA